MYIINRLTDEKVSCLIIEATARDLKNCQRNFHFDWLREIRLHEIYKLVTHENQQIVQGLMSISIQSDFIFLPLIERAGYGAEKIKLYDGVAQILIAYACRLAIELGFDGCVAFDAKSELIKYYVKIAGARQVGSSNRMIILPEQARKLVTLLYEK
ncbi:MAG: hypothetical protein ACHQD9_05330 [Chitinophagales bacterium]